MGEENNQDLTPEQKKLMEDNITGKKDEKNNSSGNAGEGDNDSNNNSNSANNANDSEFLAQAKKLKEEQESLIAERAKLAQEKKDFADIMAGAEQRGRAMAGQSEPTSEEKEKAAAMKLVEGTGLNPFA